MAEDLNIDKTDDVNGILLKNRKDVASGRSGRESINDFSKATQVVIKRNPYKEKDWNMECANDATTWKGGKCGKKN